MRKLRETRAMDGTRFHEETTKVVRWSVPNGKCDIQGRTEGKSWDGVDISYSAILEFHSENLKISINYE